MLRISLNLRGTPVLHRDQHPASIGAIVRTRGMDDLASYLQSFDYKVLALIHNRKGIRRFRMP